MEALQRALRQAVSVWKGLGRPQQIGLATVAVGALGLLVLVTTIGRQPDTAVAFSGLSNEDASSIVETLKEANIPYELGDDGTIRVPAALVNEVRVMMAGQGLGGAPAEGSGMEMFSQPSFGLTEFAQKVNYQRALEAELARSIGRMEAVQSARVHLVLPQQTLFASQQNEPSASVILDLQPGKQLDREQTRSIANLVVGSVEGLKPENLAIVDVNGNTLTDQESINSITGISNQQLDSQRSFEQSMEMDLQALLDRVLGPGRAAVRVSALLDWDQQEEMRETYAPTDPASAAIREQRVFTEAQAAGGDGAAEPGGVPGPAANEAGAPTYAGIAGSEGAYTRQESTTTYDPSKTVETIVHAPGTVERLSVSVLLDQDFIDAAQAEVIRTAVATAAGIDTEGRGDQITVTALPFSKEQIEEQEIALAQAQQQNQVETYGRIAALVLGPLAMMVGLWFILGRGPRRKANGDSDAARRALDELMQQEIIPAAGGADAAERMYAMQGAPAAIAAQQRAAKARQAIQEDPQKAYIREQITMLGKTNPATMAQLIQTWMDEDRRN